MSENISRKRRTTYPSATLKQAIELTQKIVESGLGKGPYTRQVITHTLGYSEASGLIAAKMAACVHFGIMTNNGSGYRLSSLGESLVDPTSENYKYNLCRAVNIPVLYAQLIADYNNHLLPRNLENLLMKHYNIDETVVPKVARVFRASLEYAGALKRGKVCCLDGYKPEQRTFDAMAQSLSTESSQHSPEPQRTTDDNVIPIILPETGITMAFPKEYAYDLSIGTFSNEITALRNKAISRKKGGLM